MKERNKLFPSLIVFLVIFSLALPLLPTVVKASPATEIWDWYDLDAIRNNLGGTYILMCNLDSTTAGYAELASSMANEGQGWQPIGSQEPLVPFTGTLNGQGYEIRDLFMDRPNDHGLALFARLSEGGVVKNVGVVNADITGYYSTGHHGVACLVAFSGGTVDKCYSTGIVTGDGCYFGGLVAFNGGTVSNSYSSSSVAGGCAVGGLVGCSGGIVSNSYATGSVVVQNWEVGGLVGENYGIVSNSYYNYDEVLINGEKVITIGALFDEDFNEWLASDKFLDVNERLSQESGYYLINDVNDFKQLLAFGQNSSLKFILKDDLDLDNNSGFYIPYFAGEFDGNGHKILNLSFSFRWKSQVGLFGYITSDGVINELGVENVYINLENLGSYVGGLAGINMGTVGDSYSSGSLTAYLGVGGLVAENCGSISNSYSSSSVSGQGYCLGGLVGVNRGTVSDSYSSGSVTGGWDFGGLVGWNTGTVNKSYSIGNVIEYYEEDEEHIGGLVGDNWDWDSVDNSFWDMETSGMEESAGGTGKTTVEMRDIATFTDTETEGLDEPWDIIAVNSSATNVTYTWNIVDGQTYPFLGWESGKYHLTIFSTEGGSVTATIDGDETVVGSGDTVTISGISPGTVVILAANPDAEREFGGWQGGPINGITNTLTNVTMGIHYSIAAYFEVAQPPSPPLPGCFIATAACGTPMAEEIQILREFRDEYLLTNPLGQALVDFYYRVSPPIAKFITEHPSLKPVVRAGLIPAVAMSAVAVNTTPAEKAAIAGLLMLVSVAVAIWAARRRGRGPEYMRW